MEKRCHSLQEVGLLPVGPRKVFYFPSTTHWKPMEAFPYPPPVDAPSRGYRLPGFKKPLVTEFDCPRIITSTIARLRTEHLKGRKIHPDKTRSYVQCKHCRELQLTPNHILECPTVATKLLKMGIGPSEGLFAGTPVQP
ncbi:hypothetical protein TNCV_2095581 [Trichonephila clavipes]|nr:hypothetical protein TNCV_2095581 [Trichonephila clavipes]